MASITSSAGITLFIPAIDISAAITAFNAPAAFLFTQGTSTSPATGSQARPSIFLIAKAQEFIIISGVCPIRYAAAAAAMPAAEPISA